MVNACEDLSVYQCPLLLNIPLVYISVSYYIVHYGSPINVYKILQLYIILILRSFVKSKIVMKNINFCKVVFWSAIKRNVRKHNWNIGLDFSFFHKTLDREIPRQSEIMHLRPWGVFLNIKLDLHFPGTNFLVVWSDSRSESSPVKPVRQFWIKSLYPTWSIALTVDGKIKVNFQLWNIGRMFVARHCNIMIESDKKIFRENCFHVCIT